MLPSYLVLCAIHLRQSLSDFMPKTLIEAAILFRVIPNTNLPAWLVIYSPRPWTARSIMQYTPRRGAVCTK